MVNNTSLTKYEPDHGDSHLKGINLIAPGMIITIVGRKESTKRIVLTVDKEEEVFESINLNQLEAWLSYKNNKLMRRGDSFADKGIIPYEAGWHPSNYALYEGINISHIVLAILIEHSKPYPW
jgi:hypothetical protein